MPLVVVWKMPEEIYGHNELQNGVSQKFHSLVTPANKNIKENIISICLVTTPFKELT